MQKKRVCFSVFALLLCMSSAFSSGPPSARTIVVGVYDNPPKIRMTASGEPEGVFIDVLKAVAKSQHWTVLYDYGDWSDLVAKLREGQIDLLPDVAYSAERAEYLDFCKIPVLSSWVQVLVNKGTNMTSFRDLDGKKLSILQGSIQETLCQELEQKLGISLTPVLFDTYREVIAAVERGEADGAVVSRFYAYAYAETSLVPTQLILDTTTLHFAVKKDSNADLLVAVDRELSLLLNNPESVYYESLERWLYDKPRFFVPRYIQMFIALAAAAALLLAGAAIFLKRQVSQKTRALGKTNADLEAVLALVKQHETSLEAALRMKDLYLQELLHRTRNNMAVISSLLYVKAWDEKNEVVLRYAENIDAHIAIMSLVFGLVEKSPDYSTIDICDFISGFTELFVQHNHFAQLDFKTDCTGAEFLFDTALPLGFVLYEVMISMLESAKGSARAEFRIIFKADETRHARLAVRLADPARVFRLDELFSGDRMKIILDMLEKQLMGKALSGADGSVELEFSLIRYTMRV